MFSPYFDSSQQPSVHSDASSSSVPRSNHTSVIVPTDSSTASSPATPLTPYYPNAPTPSQYPYQFPFILGSEWPFQFPPAEGGSPNGLSLSNPLGTPTFPPFGGGFYNPANRSPLSEFYPPPSPMVQYNGAQKKTAGRKPKEQQIVEMDDEDDDRKLKRRLRNKEAAARCRQRRLDLMGELQEQVLKLKTVNERRAREIQEARKQIESLKEYITRHDCKLSAEARQEMLPELANLQVLTAPVPMMVMPPRAESVAHSTMSNYSSSSSEQHSPVEEYKPCIDQLKASLPSINKLMPPPALPAPQNVPCSSISSIPSQIPARSENGFLEPELKIPKLEGDRTLSSLANRAGDMDGIERPSILGMNGAGQPNNGAITTPSRPFRVAGQENGQTPDFFTRSAPGSDFLSSNTGLTPSAQPTMNFVSTPTPLQHHSEADLRPL